MPENQWMALGKESQKGLVDKLLQERTKGKGKGKGAGKGKGKGAKGVGGPKGDKGKGKGKSGGKSDPPAWSKAAEEARNQRKKLEQENIKWKKEAQDAQEALKKAGIEPPTPAPKADTSSDEPKPLTMNNRKGEAVPVVVSCPCGQQHWSYPKDGGCIRCKAELPILEKPPKQIQERKPFLSHQAKNFFDKFEARNEPELELDDDQRQNNMTKAQSLLDTALQLGISSDEQLKMMKDTVEKFKNPKIKNTPKENSYALLAIGEKAGTEELKYWEAT